MKVEVVELNLVVIVVVCMMFVLLFDDVCFVVYEVDVWDFVNDLVNCGMIGVI